ncbi:MAG TPA: bifunctional uroporphyrinogen-III C-methyltransferase/uroporphyrinogen-III synthase [Streptosporangiaceae bacterium]|nr:bifunctional uroporphyrinogen-III C-methyltransferase/uroporphyrinogen-III synthase [Streptosporangiaceae bacterium]
MNGLAAFVGTGPGNEELLTVRAAELLSRADLVVGSPELTQQFARMIRPGAQIQDAAELDADPRLLAKAAKAGQVAVALYSGDPLLYGPAAVPAAACAKARVPFEIVPGLPPATAVPAYAGIPLTSDGSGGEVRIVQASDVSRVAADSPLPASLVILGVESASPVDLAKMLMAAGWPDTTPFKITWNGTTTEQLTIACRLGSVGADLKAAGISLLSEPGPAIGVVGEGAGNGTNLSWYETKPLFGWRVLVPRTKEQAASVSERLQGHGAVPEEVPTIAVEPPRTPQQIERAVKGLVTGRYQWVAFTSVNAVRAVREKLEEYGLDARAFAGVKVAAVGEQTAKAVQEFGIKPDLIPEGEQSGEGLAAAWQPYDDLLDPINRVLLPRADIATETLVARLTELGWEAEDVTAYRTVRAAPPPAPVREAIKGGGFDAVLFTSSSTVRNLIGIAGKPHAVTVIAAIGPQTAQTAAEYGLRVDVMAPRPSVTALVDALAEYAAQTRDAAIAAGEPVRKPSERRRGARRRLK